MSPRDEQWSEWCGRNDSARIVEVLATQSVVVDLAREFLESDRIEPGFYSELRQSIERLDELLNV